MASSTERKTQWGFALALAGLAVVGMWSWLAMERMRADAAWVEHTHEVMNRLERLFSTMTDAQNGHRGYALTGDEQFIEPYRYALKNVPDELHQLDQLTTDNPAQQQRLEALATLVAGLLERSREIIEVRRTQGLEAVQRATLSGKGKALHDEFRHVIDRMKAEESALLAARAARAHRSVVVAQTIIVVAGLLALGFVALAVLAIRRDRLGRKHAEAQLENFFSLSLDFLCIASSDGYFKRVSPAVTDVLGWRVDEFLARPFMEFVHPDDTDASLRELDRHLAGEKVLHFENRYRHKNGSWRILSWCSMPHKGLMYATARDITELKRTESALREARDQLESRVQERTAELQQTSQLLQGIIESSDDAIISKTLQGTIISWNPGAERVFGYTAQQAIGQPMSMLIPPERAGEEPQLLQRLARGESIDHFETVRLRSNGERIDVAASLSPIRDTRGEIIAISKIARDISEGKRAQARVQAQMSRLELLNRITRAIGERLDTRSIFQVVVRTLEHELPLDFCCIALYDAADSVLVVANVGVAGGLAAQLAMTEHARVPVDANGLNRCVHGELVYEPDISHVAFPFPERLAKAGLRSLVAAPLRVESQVFGVLVAARRQPESFASTDCEFLRQLSEHVALAAHQAQLHDALQKAYDDLRLTQQAVMQQERLRALGQMASGIAHDINNAISPVALYAELLLEREASMSPQARGYLETIRRAIDDVGQTVARMREFYRQRETHVALAPVQLNNIVQEVLDLTRARWSDMAHQRGISIDVKPELSSTLPPIMGAASEIREALTNLIFNAVDAMPAGGTLTLRTSDGAKSVKLEIIDTGIGMDDDTSRRCLEPFFTTKGERGTGLGLAMVYGVMQRHNAEIEIDSAPGCGTTVRLNFAVAVTGAAGHKVQTAILDLPSSLRILLVDDDPMLIKSLTDILTADGHLPTAADGGQAGIDTFRESHQRGERFDVVITDLGMPYVDGRKVAAAVKALQPSIPVLLLTGWGQRLIADGDVPPHVDRVLSKPPKLRELRETLATLVS